MANEQQASSLIYTLGVAPGIKRDGTVFESREFTDGVWTRFQRAVPVKMGGYREIFQDKYGVARGMIINGYGGQNYIFTGNEDTLNAFTTDTVFGAGSGPSPANMLVGYAVKTLVSNTSSTFTVAGDQTALYPNGTKVVFNQTPGAQQYTVSGATFGGVNTVVSFTPTSLAGAPTNVWVANVYYQPDPLNTWQFDMLYNPQGGALQVLAHAGLNLENIDNNRVTPVYAGNIIPGVGGEWYFEALADTEGMNATNAPIEVDGGVCVLYPFIFVYGSNGFIANNHVEAVYANQNFKDWNGTLANRVNMAAGKIVKGIPVRGGTNSPSGLFWATDSLIRVSFTGNSAQYWKYDIISSQISIMSSNAVVEMDGIYYWMGVDRFYLYNGTVQVLPNDKNINWVYNNLNYAQRQKVWATKVPRFNEIWFFYPRGTSTECNDAIIYNVKDKIWYDAGQAVGTHRSCGYTTEVFPSPIWASWDFNIIFNLPDNVDATPVGAPAPAGNQFYILGNVTPKFFPGKSFQFSNSPGDPQYVVQTAAFNPVYNATLITATDAVISPYPAIGDIVYPVTSGYKMWVHETGNNAVTSLESFSVPASITTCDISWVGGDPSQDSPRGLNRRIHLRRVEPDFVQTGDMTLQVIGSKFARGAQELSPVFTFGPNDGKVDLRIENRESRLKFSSDVLNGHYEMGRVLITAEPGDERP
jgi:hypothetical protein